MSDGPTLWHGMEVIRLDGMPTSVRIDCDVCNNESRPFDAFSDTITLELEGTCGSDAFAEFTGITQNETSIVIEKRVRLPKFPTVRAYKRERKGDKGKRRGKARYATVKTYLPMVRIEPNISSGPVMDYKVTTGVRVSPGDPLW